MHERNHYVYEFGPFHLDATRRLLLKEGEPVKLFPKEFDTLLALVESNGELVEKDDLMHRVWQDTIVEDSNLTTNISHLRKILGESRNRHDYIVTVPGRGYRFVAGVRQAFDEVIVRERTTVTIEEEESASQPGLERAFGESVKTLGRETEATKASGYGQKKYFLIPVTAVVVAAVAFEFYRLITSDTPKNAAAVPFSAIKLNKLTNSGRAILAAMSPDGKYVVHVSKDVDGESLWLEQVATESNLQIAKPEPVSYWGLTFSPDGEYVYCVTAESNKGKPSLTMIPVLGGPPRKLPVGPHGPISFSPDGRQFAFINAYRDVFHLNVADANGESARLIATSTPPEKFIDISVGPAWSHDGNEIACAVRKQDVAGYFYTVIGIRVADGAKRSLSTRRWSDVGQIVWLPDASGLVVVARESPSAPSQLWHLSLSGDDARRVTNDLNNYHGLSYNVRRGSLIAVQTNVVSNVWVVPSVTLDRIERGQLPFDSGSSLQIASASGRIEDVAWTPDGQVVYVSYGADGSNVWLWEPNAQGPKQLTIGARNIRGLAVSPDGRDLVFSSDRAGTFNLWRMDMSAGEPVRLTNGEGEISPRYSPDGKWIVYQRGYQNSGKIWRVPARGGEQIALTQTRAQRPDVSPDGNLIAYYTLDSDSLDRPWIFGVMPFDGGNLLKRFTFPPTVENRVVRWMPGGRGLAYLDRANGVPNIWVQPLDGGPPRRVSDFKDKHINLFDWSPDGRKLAVVSVAETSDVVLIEPSSE
jgi:Tol biopolymer transport system component/DNA-binding winged helix-turn-helix (wHTH) protein